MEHSQADKSQHAQLLSTDQANASPIAEEDEGVETRSRLPQFETTSHCPLPSVPDEGVAGAALVEDSDLDDVADQYCHTPFFDRLISFICLFANLCPYKSFFIYSF